MSKVQLSYSRCEFWASLLGAIDGFIVGVVAYFALWIVLYYEKQTALREQVRGGDIIHTTVVIKWYMLVITGVITFAAGSLLVHKYLTPRIKSNLFLWQFVGLTSIVLGMLIPVTILLIDHFTGAAPVESFQGLTRGMLMTFISILGLMIPINLVWASLIKHVPIASKLFSPQK